MTTNSIVDAKTHISVDKAQIEKYFPKNQSYDTIVNHEFNIDLVTKYSIIYSYKCISFITVEYYTMYITFKKILLNVT